MNKAKIEKALSSWRVLNKTVASLTREEAEYALIMEQMGNNRSTFLERIQQRLRAVEVEDTRNKWRESRGFKKKRG